jgi:hypothetical protein
VFVPVQNGQAGTPIKVVGQANGRAFNLLMELPQGVLYGVGTSGADLRQAAGLLDQKTGDLTQPFLVGGSFVGPLDGDAGDWARAAGSALPPGGITSLGQLLALVGTLL